MTGTAATHPPGGRPGVGLALLAAVLFGLSAPFAKLLLGRTTPQLLAGLLYLGSGLGLLAVWLVRRGGSREAPLSRRDAPWLAGAIAFGGVVGPLLLLIGLARTPAAAASLLLNLEGVLTAVLAWFVFRENFDRRIALGMLAIVAGGAVLSWEGGVRVGGFLGPLAIAGACLAWAIDNNLTQKVSGGDPVQVAMLKGLVAGTVNTAIAVTLGATWPSGGTVSAAMVLGFLSYGVSLALFVLALRHLGTARTGAYFSLAPFVGAAASVVIFRERPTALFLAGAALMALGVWFHLTERHEHEHRHEAMEHEHAHVHDEHHRHAHGGDDPPVTDPAPHAHRHRHEPMVHTHPHYPDLHHRHSHDAADANEHAGRRAGPSAPE
jgi:drug/metabolite transporter (DMT)-like permease